MPARVLAVVLVFLMVLCAGVLIWVARSDKSGIEVTGSYVPHGIRLQGKYVNGEVVFQSIWWLRSDDHDQTRPRIVIADGHSPISLDELKPDALKSWLSENYAEDHVDGALVCSGFASAGTARSAYARCEWADGRLKYIYVSETLPQTHDGKSWQTMASFDILAIDEGIIRLPMRKADADKLLGPPAHVEETRRFP